MTPERWQQIEELFRTVVHRPPGEREAHLTQVCNGDEELRQEVLSLLEKDTAEDFLREPIANLAWSLTADSPDDLTGARIGQYRLTRLIGRGGMGAVYEAVRDDKQFQQQVALKLIKRGMDSAFVRERFLRERQILASLDHPCIAHLLDGGTTPDGQPYFVMEFVAGESITEYCDRRKLTLDEKLNLFRQVCSAVQHAHQKLVVHRDLKPSNILVTASADGKGGTPKLLDFGIAKLLAADPGEAVTRTETALRLMTPDYASPEQVRGGAITTATDVYALGAVLYELLTGQRPHQFETYSPMAIERAICETEAPRPSDLLERVKLEGPKTKSRRFFSATSFNLQPADLRGDLDNIVLMAMRKEPERRYPSVEQLSEDLRRYLVGLPITARPDTFVYRAGKFVRRHRMAVTAAILAAISLLGGIIAATYSARQARVERDRANQAAVAAQTLAQSFISVFEFADPGNAKGNSITTQELLDQGAEKVRFELNNQPLMQAKLLGSIGELYVILGLYDRAQSVFEQALALRRNVLGAEHLEVAESLNHLGALEYEKGNYANSETRYRDALALQRKFLEPTHPVVADTMVSLGRVLVARGKFTEAEPLIRDGLKLQRNHLGPEHKDVAESLHRLGRLLSEQGKFGEAAEIYKQALGINRKLYGAENPSTAASLNNLAVMLHQLGDYNAAELMSREVLSMRQKLHGAEHPNVAASLANLAALLQDKREYAESEKCYRQSLAILHKLFDKNPVKLASTMNNFATLLEARGKYEESESLHSRALELCRKEWGEDHREVATSLYGLAAVLYLKRQYAEAEKLQRQAIVVYQKSLQPDHWMIGRSYSHLGACLVKLKRYGEAEESLLSAYAGLKAARGEQHELTRKTAARLVELYEAWGKPDQAALYRTLP